VSRDLVQVRKLLAELGFRSLDELVGRTDLLAPREVALTKTKGLDLTFITDSRGRKPWAPHKGVHSNGDMLDDDILTSLRPVIETQVGVGCGQRKVLQSLIDPLSVTGRGPPRSGSPSSTPTVP
jgi:hypothetical protein